MNKRDKIQLILRGRFPEAEYALMSEVSDAAGLNRSRSADFMAMSLWPSRGLAVHGFELKSNRGDWLNERKNPEKAENVFKYCDRWWLLTDNDKVAKLEEIPETWGWLQIKGEKTYLMKEAPKLKPIPLSNDIVATMLKRAQSKDGWLLEATIDDRIKAAENRGYTKAQNETLRRKDRANEIIEAVRQYKEVTGIDLESTGWRNSAKQIGEAVKYVQDVGIEKLEKRLKTLNEIALEIHSDISKHLVKSKLIEGK